jgi:hemerythrin
MGLIQWDPDWETGIIEVDAQHRVLLNRLGQLATALAEGWHASETEKTMLYLGDYVETHFRAEEAIMERCGYPGLEQHRAVHDDLRRRVATLAEAYHRDPRSLPADVMDFLMGWLVDHLAGEDKLMATFLREQASESSRTV